MKNIHVLPTDKPSRLYLTTKEYVFEEVNLVSTDECQNKHIYITSDEEIKEGDWYITPNNTVLKALGKMLINVEDYKKIILTTDQELIQDGVQAIDDEFLEWFVKNSSCEFVEVTEYLDSGFSYGYKIINPKEEPKQDWYCPKCQSYVSSESVTFEETHQICNTSVIIQEPKQETLEEVSEMHFEWTKDDETLTCKDHFISGAKWQQEQWEEDLKEAFSMGRLGKTDMSFKEWFEQFKNK